MRLRRRFADPCRMCITPGGRVSRFFSSQPALVYVT